MASRTSAPRFAAVLWIALFLCCLAGIAAVQGEAQRIVTAEEGPFHYQVMTMDNGMKVITLEDHSCPIAAIQVWYHVGSKNEQPDRRGFAHMFEHMMFRGTDRLGPEDHFNFIRHTGGNCNAYTSFDQTVYVQTVPSNQVELVFWLESERMGFLKIDERGFDTERNVVAEEYRMGAEQPYGTVLDQLLPRIFRDGTYSWSVIGNMDELRASTSEDLQMFWETYYIPGNAALVVVGDIEHEAVQALAKKYFGWIPAYPDPPGLAVPPAPPNDEPMRITIQEKNGPAPILAIGYLTVPVGHPDVLSLEMLGSILGGGESSRLYKRLVLKDGTAMMAMAGGFSMEKAGVLGAGAVLNPLSALNPFSKDHENALAAMREEIARLKEEGPTEKEVLKARNNALRSAVTSQLSVASKANVLGNAAVIEKDLPGVNQQFDRIRAVTKEDIKRVANTYMKDAREIEIEIKPSVVGFIMSQVGGKKETEGTESAAAAEAAVVELEEVAAEAPGKPSGKPGLTKIRPEDFGDTPPEKPTALAMPRADVREFVLENGLKVVMIPNHEVPFVTYTLGLKAGAYTDPPDAPGTASMAAQMLTRGTAGHTYEALAEILDTYAISISGSAGMDTATVTASAVTDEAARAMKHLAEVVITPTFPEDQFKTLLRQARTGKAIEEKSPEYLAGRELRMRLFGDHPYARSATGEMSDLEKVNVEGMKAWWTRYARPDMCVLYLAGDLDAAEGRKLAARYFSDWTAEGPKPRPALPTIPEAKATHIYLVDRKSDQAQLRVGQVGITRDHPLHFTARVLSEIFGGGFNSRLNRSIRVEKGLTYGARGGFDVMRFAGRFTVSTFTKNDSVGEALEAILVEIRRLKKEPPSEEEMEMAKNYLAGDLVLGRETPQSLVSDQWLIEYEGLPKDYMQRYLEGVQAATTQEVARAGRELVDEEKLTIVVVGQADQIKEQLEAIAPVTVIKERS